MIEGHHSERSDRGWWIAAGAVVLAMAIAAGILVGVHLARRGDDSDAGATCGGRPVLRVTVTPEFADIVNDAAQDVGDIGTCSLILVQPEPVTRTLTELANRPPDVWIPASSAWLRLATAGGRGAPASTPSAVGATSDGPSGPAASTTRGPGAGGGAVIAFADNPVSLARSPIVIAAPRPFAESLGWPATQPSWTELTTRVVGRQIPRFSMASPMRDTSGLLAVLGVQAAMGRTTTDPGIAQMRALTLRARLAEPEADPAALLDRLGRHTDATLAAREVGLFPITEQALFGYLKANHSVPAAAIYPPDGLLEADYPLALTNRTAADSERRALAAQLANRIRARDFTDTLIGQGFRPAAQTAAAAGTTTAVAPTAPGLLPGYAQPTTMPAQVAEPAAMWAQYRRLTYQVLLLVDGSGSMNDQVRDRSGNLTTKSELLRLAGVQAAQLFGEDTSLGMWLFATPTSGSPPYTVALPYGPINDSVNGVPRRDLMRQVAQGYKAYPSAGTPLFETVLRGTAEMRERFRPDASTLVVVLTDGQDRDTRFAMGRAEFLNRLNADRDPARPVPVFAIGYGTDADMGVLRDIARLTGGQAVASNDPGDLASAMAKIFLAAHQPR
jgi:Ca-activated chloride channel homolog